MAVLEIVAVNRMPAADVEVSADLVRRLLADQHPDLARLPVEFLANGWDNELYRVGDGLVARLPRRALGAQIITNEQRWLPGLAARLPLPIPSPERTGVPACGYPYSWSVVPYLPGVPAAQASSFDPAAAAAAVGGFLGALHVPAPADAPANPFRGVPLAERAGTFAANLARLARPGRPGRGAARVGRGAHGPRLRRPARVAARRPAPGEHPGERRPGQRRDRLRRYHRGRSGQRPVGGLDAAPGRRPCHLLVGLPGGRRAGPTTPCGPGPEAGP